MSQRQSNRNRLSAHATSTTAALPVLRQTLHVTLPALVYHTPAASVPRSTATLAPRLSAQQTHPTAPPGLHPSSTLEPPHSPAVSRPVTRSQSRMGTANAVEKRERTRTEPQLELQFPYHSDSNSSLGERTEREALGEGGYHPVRIGDTFKNGTYRVLARLGCGHFSTVWLCVDNSRRGSYSHSTSDPDIQSNAVVALKIQKSAAAYSEAAKDEIKLLEAVKKRDPSGAAPVISLLDHFEHFGPNGRHVCLVFNVLGSSLLKVIKRFNYKGVPIPLVRKLARDILEGLHFLHTEVGIIHTDLKPENVLFEIPDEMLVEIEAQGTAYAQKIMERRRDEAVRGTDPTSGKAPVRITMSKSYRKNQKKRMKAKAKKAAEREAAGEAAPSDVKRHQPDEGSQVGGTSVQVKVLASPPQSMETAEATASSSQRESGQDRSTTQAAKGGKEGRKRGAVEQLDLNGIVNKDKMFSRGFVKIADLGNACWTDKHFTGDIQTRQYRSPEVIVGSKYNHTVDIWSAACVIFELLTGDYLFDPHSGIDYDRDEDHLALMIELLGPMPRFLTKRGEFSRELFTRNSELKHIRRLDYFPLVEVLEEKYKMDSEDAEIISSFLEPMLRMDPNERANAKECLAHPFFEEARYGAEAYIPPTADDYVPTL